MKESYQYTDTDYQHMHYKAEMIWHYLGYCNITLLPVYRVSLHQNLYYSKTTVLGIMCVWM